MTSCSLPDIAAAQTAGSGAWQKTEGKVNIHLLGSVLHYLNKKQRVKWKVLLKSHKIKWKDEQLLAVILIFLIDLFRRCT